MEPGDLVVSVLQDSLRLLRNSSWIRWLVIQLVPQEPWGGVVSVQTLFSGAGAVQHHLLHGVQAPHAGSR